MPETPELPAFERPVPVCPVRGSVLFPTMVMPIDAGRPISIRAINTALDRDRSIVIVSQREREIEDPSANDLYETGTACHIMRMKKNPDGSIQMLVRAVARVSIDRYTTDAGVIEAQVRPLDVPLGDEVLLQAAFRELKEKFGALVEAGHRGLQPEVAQFVLNLEDPGQFADYVAYHLDFRIGDKQAVLEAESVAERLRKVLVLIDTEIELQETQRRLQREVKDEIDRNQREYFLREQIKALQKELSGSDEEEDEVEAFREKLDALELPEAAMKEAQRELNRLARMHPDSAEASVIRTYLTTITELPWNVRSEDKLDIEAAAEVLEEDHYGLEKVKDRVLEYLAVRKLKQDRAEKGELDVAEVNRGPILLFVGPPGVGKTSIAKSIGKAIGREYVRISLGGARDESDIRGHRRTYIGSMPGRVLQNLGKVGTRNPLYMLDELDKMSMDFRGDPSSALLEVLDPEQNNTFGDHYLEVDFDLSEVMFVATANSLNIPPALLDRMEIIRIPGYTEDEKLNIATRYLLPKQVKQHGLKDKEISVSEGAITDIIRYYTREAGVRNLERELAKICRKVVKELSLDKKLDSRQVTVRNLDKYLGVRRHRYGRAEEENEIGQVTGLAWTEVGGELLQIEAAAVPGKGKLTHTGQLGNVMQESVQAALSVVRSRAQTLGIAEDFHQNRDIHIHVPEGATPKDGPSAGIAMVTALVSILTSVAVRADVAMTGEITLRGKVLPIGGLKEKLLAALRGGIRLVLIPAENEKDLAEIPQRIKKDLDIRPVQWIDEVLELALEHLPEGDADEASPAGASRGKKAAIRAH